MTTLNKPIRFSLNNIKELHPSSFTPKSKPVLTIKVNTSHYLVTEPTPTSNPTPSNHIQELPKLAFNSLRNLNQKLPRLETGSQLTQSSTTLHLTPSLDSVSQSMPRNNHRKYAKTTLLREDQSHRFAGKLQALETSPKSLSYLIPQRTRHNTYHAESTNNRSRVKERESSHESPKYHSLMNILGNESTTLTPKSSIAGTSILPPIDLPNIMEKDESMARSFKAQKLVTELEKNVVPPADVVGMRAETKFAEKEAEKMISLAGQVLSIMNIAVRIPKVIVKDSAMVVYPITNRMSLANFYKVFVPMLCQIPFSFLNKLKISMFSVCQQVELQYASDASSSLGVLEQKLLNGLFILKRLPSKEAVRDHLHRIILYHFVKKRPGFYEEWKLRWTDEVNPKLLGKPNAPTPFGDLLITFQQFMAGKDSTNPDECALGRLDFLRLNLEEFDPESFEEDEWGKNQAQSIVIDCDKCLVV